MEIVEEWSKLANHVCPDKVNLEFIQPKLNFLLSKHIRSRSSIVVGVSSQQCSAIVSYNARCRLFQICKGVFTETKFKAVGYNKDVAHAYLMARKHDISISTPNDLISYGIKAILGALNDHTSVDARRFSIVCTVNDVPCKFCDPEQVKLFVCRIMEEQTKSTT
uniref:Proteasome subunit alpha type-6 n=1 Tax=Rhabditophanes sp. KR3021 TaxID=114890 RepID=A0AC35U258_9BILA